MTTANELHNVEVDGQTYIIRRSGCITGRRNFYTGRNDYEHEKCTRWRWAENQGYHAWSMTHIALICRCRKCGHEEFILADWLQSESFTSEHTKHKQRQAERKSGSYPSIFERVWSWLLLETVRQVSDDLSNGGIEEAMIKLSTILEKIEAHKVNHLAVEGWEPE